MPNELGDRPLARAPDLCRNLAVLGFPGNRGRIHSSSGCICTTKKSRLFVAAILQPGTAACICLAGNEELLEAALPAKCIGFLEHFENRLWAQFQRPVTVRVKLGDDQAKVAACLWNRQSFAHGTNQLAAAYLMSGVTGQLVFRCIAFAEVMRERRESHFEIIGKRLSLVEHHHRMQPCVDFRVPALGLRNAKQGIDLREQDTKGATVSQNLEKYAGVVPGKGAFGFLPDAIGYECIDFTVSNHAPHQAHGLASDPETKVMKASGETRYAQDSYRVFGKCVRHMSKDPVLDIPNAPIRVDKIVVGIPGDRVDGEIPALEVLLYRYLGRAVDVEAVIAGGRLALGTGERVFLLRLRVEEYGEVPANSLVALCFEFCRMRAHDTPVPFAMRDAKQFVANCATYEIDLHRVIVP